MQTDAASFVMMIVPSHNAGTRNGDDGYQRA